MNEENYIDILQKSLEKKINVLKEIKKLEEKHNVFTESSITEYLDEKESLLEELEKLDDGFEIVYNRVKLQLKENSNKYKMEINNMQNMIKKITDIAVDIKANEERLKIRFENFCTDKRTEIKNFKMSKKTVSNYYKNMKNIHQNEQSYFLDKKK